MAFVLLAFVMMASSSKFGLIAGMGITAAVALISPAFWQPDVACDSELDDPEEE